MKITFCGAARFVTGSSHLITLDSGCNILLDCGLMQGSAKEEDAFNGKWLFDPKDIDIVILSHAHIDHTGRLPKLVRDGFKGEIISTHATRSLCSIMLLDSAHIQERDAEYDNKKLAKKHKNFTPKEPLYEKSDVAPTLERFSTIPYGKWFQVHRNVEVFFSDAGHILGSAAVSLRLRENRKIIRLGFTGDIGRPDRPILRDPKPMPACDYLICESTYGDKDHEAKPDQQDRFLEILKRTIFEKKGKLIIPAFSVGRTQEIVYMLDQLETEGLLPKVPIYVDSPLAVNATRVFGSHPECYDAELQEYLLTDPNPFGFTALHYVTKVEDSKRLNTSEEPCVIISASGMITAGRIRHHLFNAMEDPKNTLLIVGYCSPDSAGGILLAGAKELKMFGEVKPVNLEIQRMESFSAHGDRYEMISFIKNQKELKKLFLVHGEYDSQMQFADLLNSYGWEDVEIPSLGQEYIVE